MPYINLYSGTTLVDILAQQQYERRLAQYQQRQALALRLQEQEEEARQYAAAEQLAYREALRRASLREQLEAERQEYLRQRQIEAEQEAIRQAKIREKLLLEERIRKENVAAQKRKIAVFKRQQAEAAHRTEQARRAEAAHRAEQAQKAEEARIIVALRRREEQQRYEEEQRELLSFQEVNDTDVPNGQQKYRVITAPFPNQGYYLVPIKEEDVDMDNASDDDLYNEAPTPDAVEEDDDHDSEGEVSTADIAASATSISSEETEVSQNSSRSEAENEAVLIGKLNRIKDEVDSLAEVYDRLFKAESGSGSGSGSSSDSDASISSSAIASRVKVLQKTQLKLEKLYTELDGLATVPESHKKFKRDLTNRSVSYADKIEAFLKVLEEHKSKVKLSEEGVESKPKELKKLRRVTIETVDDDSDF